MSSLKAIYQRSHTEDLSRPLLTAPVMVGNPAIALMVRMTISLFLNRAPIANGSTYGKHLLQTAIVLLGLKLNATELLDISSTYARPVATFVCTTLIVGLMSGWLARSDRTTNALISSGTAICGGTTIATLSPILTARPEQTGAALCVVFLLNAIALMTFHRRLVKPKPGAIRRLGCVSHTRHQFCRRSGPDVRNGGCRNRYNNKNGPNPMAYPLDDRSEPRSRNPAIKDTNSKFHFRLHYRISNRFLIGFSSSALTTNGHVVASLLVVASFFVGTEITRETLKSLAFTSVAHGVVLWLLVILAVLWGVTLMGPLSFCHMYVRFILRWQSLILVLAPTSPRCIHSLK